MSDEQSGSGTKSAEGSAPGRSPIVFVSDASAEAERIADALRALGYVVADVPLDMLPSRASAQRPNVVIADIDADGAMAELAKLRRLPGSGAIDFVYLGRGEGPVKNADDALANDGSAFFLRPVDVGGLLRKLEALTGGPLAGREIRPSTPPPSIVPKRVASGPAGPALPLGAARSGSDRPSASPSLPAPGLRTPGPPLPMSTTSLADLVDAPRSLASFGTVSAELQQLLADAEMHAEVMPAPPEAALPTPEEEIEAVLPADVLASLDEPIEGENDDESSPDAARVGTGTGHNHDGTGAHGKGTTSGGTRQPTTGSSGRSGTSSQTHERRAASDAPPRTGTGSPSTTPGSAVPRRPTDASPQASPSTDAAPRSLPVPDPVATRSELPRADRAERVERVERVERAPSHWPPPVVSSMPPGGAFDSAPPRASARASAGAAGSSAGGDKPRLEAGVVLGPGDARRFFADAIARRASGALAFDGDGVVRRVVIRDGDLVTAASSADSESLVHFLAARGELPRDEAPRLSAKVPPHGRHAGAALVAHGWLRQDQLWVVLRAHAEWIATAVLRLTRGTAQIEADVPARLRGEPSVFGASTGAEIFVELVRRAVAPDEALERLGGEGSRIGDGPNLGLLAECNLPPQDLDLLSRTRGGAVADLLSRAPDPEIVAVVHALALLGVVDIAPAPDFARRDAREESDREVAALDEDAIRARVRARLELVEEGDYFAVLGITRDATGYEVRRAFVELRRAFEPSRILTPRLLDLADAVKKIVVVLEEAYEILRDPARRERYRRAIDARPE